jgi:chemotaxis protein MotD
MPGELFRIIADAAGSRGGARSGGAAAGGSTEGSAFRQLLRAVSQQSKVASMEQGCLEPAKPNTVRFHASPSPALDDGEDDARHSKSSAPTDEQEPTKQEPAGASRRRPDHTVQSDDQHRLSHLSPIAAETAVATIPGSEAQAVGNLVPAQAATPSTDRNGMPSSAPSMTGEPEHAARLEVKDARGALIRHGAPAASRSISAAPGFETVSANLEGTSKLSGREASASEIGKVSVIQQETHFSPVPELTTLQRIADSVVAELKGSSSASAVTASDLASSTKGPDQPLKILTIRLDPPSLGSVTVRFRLTGDSVSIHLAADRRETTRFLEEHRDSIKELMRSVGYAADVASVQHGSLDGFQSGSGQPPSSLGDKPQQQAPQSQGSADTFGPSSDDAQNGAWRQRQERDQNREVRHEQDMVPNNRRGALYL